MRAAPLAAPACAPLPTRWPGVFCVAEARRGRGCTPSRSGAPCPIILPPALACAGTWKRRRAGLYGGPRGGARLELST